MKQIGIYLKTTETCNLNCKHCFTNGTSGPKVFWDHLAVTGWMRRLAAATPMATHVHCDFHGGEPFLAPVHTMQYVWEQCKDLWPSVSWGVTTNLTFKLTREIQDFIEGPLAKRVGTSWDSNIRFATQKQHDLWESNVRTLISAGVEVMVFVSVTKAITDAEPRVVYDYMQSLGIHELAFERLTHNGSANKHPDIFPTNAEQDAWFVKMHDQYVSNPTYTFRNLFLEGILTKFDTGMMKSGTFCRDCESKLFTLNATGTIAGCPNSAPEQHFGVLSDDINTLLLSPGRIDNMACERRINTICHNCDVYGFCGGDCHQLAWDGEICGAPKTLMMKLKQTHTPVLSYPIFSLRKV